MQEMFVAKRDGQIATNEGICLDSMEKRRPDEYAPGERRNATMVRIVQCAESAQRQRWLWDARVQQLRPAGDAHVCLTGAEGKSSELAESRQLRAELRGEERSTDVWFEVTVRPCEVGDELQRWVLLPLPWR